MNIWSKPTSNVHRRGFAALWVSTNKIVVLGSRKYSGFRKKYVCYKEKLFRDNGWCYRYPMHDPNGKLNENNWGFCGSSCKLMEAVRIKPAIYHKMTWEYPPKKPTQCPWLILDPNNHHTPYFVCMSTYFPPTNVFKFKRSKRRNRLELSNVYHEKIEDTFDGLNDAELLTIGYQQPCSGDSGSGNWMYDLQSGRRALVAVTSHTPAVDVCGASTHSVLTTHPNVLRWIKTYSNI